MVRYDLEGRLAVVTGGGGGLGVAIARALLDAGGRVALWDRALASELVESLPGQVVLAQVDVTDADVVEAAAAALEAEHGRCSILVNNAGVLGPVQNGWEIDPATFRHVLDVNLTGAFICCRAIVPRMLAAPPPTYGRIVNMASLQAKEGTAKSGPYAASKAGLIALTKTLGKELAGTGVLVNAVAPTAAETAMAAELTPERRADLLGRIPMGRFATPEEIAAQVVWLASDACSFATGAVFDVSGGRATS